MRGCFFKIVFLFVLLVGIAAYYWQYHSIEIKSYIKDKYFKYTYSEVFDKIGENISAENFESVSKVIQDFINSIDKETFTVAKARAVKFFTDLKNYLSDDKINYTELNKLKEHVK